MTEACEAAAAWGGRVVRLISERENAVYEMALPGQRAALRLHRVGYHSEAVIRSELWWAGALVRSGVAVPSVLAAQNGDFLVRLAGGRFASAIAWAEGQPLGVAGVPLTGTVAEQVALHRSLGRLLAQVHAASDALIRPKDFSRPIWDLDGLTGDAPVWGPFWQHPAATPAQAAILRSARGFLRDRLQAVARDADFGLIHADVLRENVLVADGALTLIDFDDSGTGFRLYDLGTALSQNLYEPAFAEIRAALIAGYAETRPCDGALVDLLTLGRTLASVGWVMPRLPPGDPVHLRHIARAVMCAGRVMGQTSI